jgi:AraC-like DNA-binding protein
LLSSPTVRDAGATMARFGALLTDSGRWEMRERGARAEMVWHRAAGFDLGNRLSNETALAQCLRGLERLAGQRIAPIEVAFRHAAPAGARVHADFFQGRVRFGADEDRIVLARELLDAAPAGAHRGLWGYLCTQAEALCDAAAPATAARAVTARLHRALRDGRGDVPALGEVAQALGSSERTLRRRLSEDGTSWRALLDDARRTRARELMAERHASVIEAALALGFSDGTAFTHACRRWFGRPPSALRGRPRTQS